MLHDILGCQSVTGVVYSSTGNSSSQRQPVHTDTDSGCAIAAAAIVLQHLQVLHGILYAVQLLYS